ncbi:hypothetical protein BGZ60DRAFT_4305 [Tricladium varicosporioides]|nr:hypothetical protein BGZ60DRAFT_4305 [Hymenoscyphus varicosporioides]
MIRVPSEMLELFEYFDCFVTQPSIGALKASGTETLASKYQKRLALHRRKFDITNIFRTNWAFVTQNPASFKCIQLVFCFVLLAASIRLASWLYFGRNWNSLSHQRLNSVLLSQYTFRGSYNYSNRRGLLGESAIRLCCLFGSGWFFEWPRGKHPLSSTWPWADVKPSLLVLWGVCWMFVVAPALEIPRGSPFHSGSYYHQRSVSHRPSEPFLFTSTGKRILFTFTHFVTTAFAHLVLRLLFYKYYLSAKVSSVLQVKARRFARQRAQ